MSDGNLLTVDSTQPGGSGTIDGQGKFKFAGLPFQVRWPIFSSSAGMGGDTVIAQMIVLEMAATLTSLEIWIQAPDGSNVRLGLWDDTGVDSRPGALLATTAILPAVAGRMVVPVTTPAVLPKGVYWIGINSSAGLDFREPGFENGWKVFRNGVAFGALPDPFGVVDGDQGECASLSAHFNGS